MKALPAVVVVALATCSVAAAAGGPAAPVIRTIRAEAAAVNAHSWSKLWALHSPRFRAKCDYRRYVAAERRTADSGPIIVRVTEIRVVPTSATAATASYSLVFGNGGRKVRNASVPFAKVGATWLEDYAPAVGCGY